MEHIDSPRLSTKLTKAQPAVDVLIKRTFISLPLYCLLLVGISVQATLASGNVDDSSDRPFFVFSLNVCNAPSQLIYEFEAKGDQLSFKLVNESVIERIVLRGRKLFITSKFDTPTKEVLLDVLVFSNGTSGGEFATNQARLRLNVADRYCPSAAYCTIVIVFLACLSLALLTSLALLLIVLRRKKPFVFPHYYNRKERGSDGQVSRGTSSLRDESYINPRKSSSVEQAQQQTHQQSWTSDGPPAFFSTTNGISNIDINRHSPKPAMAQPRKSSLKTSKLFTSRGDEAADSPSFHRSASYCNGAFDEGVAGDASDADKDSRKSSDGSASESPVLGPDEPRRKSVVTFAHTAQVIQITSSDGK